MRYIAVNDSEEVLRAIKLTDAACPIDLIVHTPGGLVLAVGQIAHALKRHPAKVFLSRPARSRPSSTSQCRTIPAAGGAERAGSSMRAGPTAGMKRWWLTGWTTAKQWRMFAPRAYPCPAAASSIDPFRSAKSTVTNPRVVTCQSWR